jgi:ferredoxin-type protein NapH
VNVPGLKARRRALQCAVALLFVVVPLLNVSGWHFLSGNLFSFSVGPLPLADPLASGQVWAASGALTASMLAGAGLPLLLALVLGPVFCSWLCPYGLFSELVFRFRAKASPMNGIDKAAQRGAKKAAARPLYFKICLVCAAFAFIVFCSPAPWLNQLSMPGWYSSALQHAALHEDVLWGAGIVIAVLALEVLSGRRLWCHYVCPQSVPLCLAGMILPGRVRVRFTAKACLGRNCDRACAAACSLGLNPRATGAARNPLCTNCGDCLAACRERGRALNFGSGR